jgi:hypothetical protein
MKRSRWLVVIAGALLFVVGLVLGIATTLSRSTPPTPPDTADGLAQFNVQAALTAAKRVFARTGDVREISADELSGLIPGVAVVGTRSTRPDRVSIQVFGASDFRASAIGSSGRCFAARVRVEQSKLRDQSYARKTTSVCVPKSFMDSEFSRLGWVR